MRNAGGVHLTQTRSAPRWLHAINARPLSPRKPVPNGKNGSDWCPDENRRRIARTEWRNPLAPELSVFGARSPKSLFQKRTTGEKSKAPQNRKTHKSIIQQLSPGEAANGADGCFLFRGMNQLEFGRPNLSPARSCRTKSRSSRPTTLDIRTKQIEAANHVPEKKMRGAAIPKLSR